MCAGGDSGIGRAVAVHFAREGADVAIVHLPDEMTDAEETVALVEKEGRKCLKFAGDVGKPEVGAGTVARQPWSGCLHWVLCRFDVRTGLHVLRRGPACMLWPAAQATCHMALRASDVHVMRAACCALH